MNYEYLICAVSVPFLEYKGDEFKDGTQDILRNYYNEHKIDNLITEPEYTPEWIARDQAAQYLISQGVEIIILVDSDEIWKEEQIQQVLGKVCLDKFTSWFSVQYRNYVFTKDTYLEEFFTPPRIFRVRTNGYTIQNCVYDNDFNYGTECFEFNKNCKKVVSYKELPTKLIRGLIIDHFSWLSCENSRRKVEYQTKRWGKDGCSYAWLNGRLIFNEEFYKKNNLNYPKILKK
jgi:hypothetical protein